MQALIDSPKKVCRVCGVEKELSQFHPNKSCKLGVVGTCKECGKTRLDKWYKTNRNRLREKMVEKNRSRKLEAVEYFGNKCHDCGNTYPQFVYEFHHLDPTKKDVNPSYAISTSSKRMWKELEKCIMLCANCHKIRHWGSY